MRRLQIALLTMLMRSLQTWTQSLSRRLATAQRATADSQPIHARVRPAQARPTLDDRTTEVPEPPANWLERTAPAQPPARWLTMVHRRAVDSRASTETTTSDQPIESTPNFEPARSEVDNASQPMRPSDRSTHVVRQESLLDTRPTEPVPTADHSASTAMKPQDVTRRSMPLTTTRYAESTQSIEQSEQPPSVPQRPQSTGIKVEPIEAEPFTSAVQVLEDVPVRASIVDDEPMFIQEPADLKRINTRNISAPDRPAERPRLALQSTEIETPRAALHSQSELRSHSTQPAPFDSAQQIDLMALRSLASQRGWETADDHSEIKPNSAASSSSSQTWATFARAGEVAPEVTALENRWPTLLDEPRTINDGAEFVLRDWERLRRLDLEQRGLGWSA